MAHLLAAEAEADLDEIWSKLVEDTGSTDLAGHVIAAITERFYLLANYPRAGRARDEELGAGRRSFTVKSYIVYSIRDNDVLILRVAHGRRDLNALMSGRSSSSPAR